MTAIRRSLLLGLAAVMLFAGLTRGQEQEELAAKELAAIIEVETPVYDFDQVLQGTVVKHEFRIFNRGNALLKIESVSPD